MATGKDTDTTSSAPAADWANSGQLSNPTSDPDDRIGPGAELSASEEKALRSGDMHRVTLEEVTQPAVAPSA